MTVSRNDDIPVHRVSRISTRILTGSGSNSENTTVWQQWLEPGHYIPEHYHDVEEVLLLTRGELELTVEGKLQMVEAPATIVVPPRQLHAMRPHANSSVELLAIFPVGRPKIFAADGSERPMPWQDGAPSE